MNLLASQPQLRDRLIQRATPPMIEGGRPRLPGHWPIAYLLFVASREPTFRRWWKKTNHRMWRRCGFVARPKYDTTHHHFARLEEHAEAFRLAAIELIERAVSGAEEGMIGRDIHIDGTEAESNARVYHACNPTTCPRGRGRGRSPIKKTPTPLSQAQRQREAAQEPGTETGRVTNKAPDGVEGLYQMSTGCWYSTSDPTAGLRSYRSSGRSADSMWVGFIHLKAVDHYTGSVLATVTIPANMNESKAYPELLNRVIENTGVVPRAVVGDRGFSVSEVFELNTRMGIASVFPWRKANGAENRDNVGTDHYDQHGIPKCQKCHGPSRFVRFSAKGTPRLWFECENGCGSGSVVCSRGWRYLLPLWRTEEAYLALRHAHSHYEKVHWRWRDTFLVGPDNATNRPRRRGIACQRLRSEAALLLEWLLVCWRQGWIDGRVRNENESFKRHAQRQLRRFERARARKGLDRPPIGWRLGITPRARTG